MRNLDLEFEGVEATTGISGSSTAAGSSEASTGRTPKGIGYGEGWDQWLPRKLQHIGWREWERMAETYIRTEDVGRFLSEFQAQRTDSQSSLFTSDTTHEYQGRLWPQDVDQFMVEGDVNRFDRNRALTEVQTYVGEETIFGKSKDFRVVPELSPQRKPLAQAPAVCSKASKGLGFRMTCPTQNGMPLLGP